MTDALQVAEKLAAEAQANAINQSSAQSAGIVGSGYASSEDPASYYTNERKLQIFHTILQRRPELSVLDAAKQAAEVYGVLCAAPAKG